MELRYAKEKQTKDPVLESHDQFDVESGSCRIISICSNFAMVIPKSNFLKSC